METATHPGLDRYGRAVQTHGRVTEGVLKRIARADGQKTPDAESVPRELKQARQPGPPFSAIHKQYTYSTYPGWDAGECGD